MEKRIKKLDKVFKSFPDLKLVYLFGSRARKDAGPLSDYDFAVYFDERDKKKLYNHKFRLESKISGVLKEDKIDIVVFNLTDKPELKYNIIREGALIFEKGPFKILVEPRILNEYFDFRYLLRKYDMTDA